MEESKESEKKEGKVNQPNFLEMSIVSEIIQTIEQIDLFCEGKVGEDIVSERVKQVAYAKLLCNIYNKDITFLIKAQAKLGIAYYDIEYYEQAQDHLLAAFKLNDNLTDEQNLSMKEFQIKILVNLSKCYLESDKSSPALQICERSLKMNQAIFGKNHISNADIFYVISKANTKLGNYENSIEALKEMLKLYEKNFGLESELAAKALFEIGSTYEIWNKANDAIDNLNEAYSIYEKVADESNNYEILFKIAIKLANLYSKFEQNEQAYTILCNTEVKYSDKVNRPVKDRFVYQKYKIKYCSFQKDLTLYLNEHLKLEQILNETDENRKTLARTCISIAYAYLENGNEDKCIEYLGKAETIFVENGDDKFANEVKQRKNEILNKQEVRKDEEVFNNEDL